MRWAEIKIMNNPKTIADLNINWNFTIENRNFAYFELDFWIRNPDLKNYKIKPDNYVFEIEIRNQKFTFEVLTKSYRNNLYDLIHQIHEEITTIYNKNFNFPDSCFRLLKFKETVFFNTFVIEVEEI